MSPGMQYHKLMEHFDKKPFSCEDCGAKFVSNSTLKNHLWPPWDAQHCSALPAHPGRFPWWIPGVLWRVGSHSDISFGIILPTASNHRGLSHHSPDCAGFECSVLKASSLMRMLQPLQSVWGRAKTPTQLNASHQCPFLYLHASSQAATHIHKLVLGSRGRGTDCVQRCLSSGVKLNVIARTGPGKKERCVQQSDCKESDATSEEGAAEHIISFDETQVTVSHVFVMLPKSQVRQSGLELMTVTMEDF
ncbi:Zinc finger and BTB domain-containing protein 40 [Aix galericulata]|nr:Zinc finger and BTB domain-containing protein 40 [Aix galericulata]